MKKRWVYTILLLVLMVACSSANIEFAVDTAPTYKPGEADTLIIYAEDGGEAVAGLDIIGTLEMAKMDHGIIEVSFIDNGDGTYSGEVELPMGGEWLMDLHVEKDGEVYEDLLTFDVSEG